MKSWNELLADELHDRHITIPQAARRACVTTDVVQRWLDGTEIPTRQNVCEIFGRKCQIQHRIPPRPKAAEAPPPPAPLPEAPSTPEPAPRPTFGAALRAAREAAGLSREDLGSLVDEGVTSSAVAWWESDTNAPIRAHYDALLDLFPVLRDAPEPAARDIEKPGRAPGADAAKPASPLPSEAPPAPAPVKPTPTLSPLVALGRAFDVLVALGRPVAGPTFTRADDGRWTCTLAEAGADAPIAQGEGADMSAAALAAALTLRHAAAARREALRGVLSRLRAQLDEAESLATALDSALGSAT